MEFAERWPIRRDFTTFSVSFERRERLEIGR